jgi:hypothetical protein
MVKTRRHGQGSIEWIHHDGYLWARGRLRHRGDLYLTDGIGAGASALADLAKRDRDAIEAEIQRRIDDTRAELERGRKPDRANAQRQLRRQLDVWLEAGRSRMLPHSHRDYVRAVERHVKPFAIARVELGELGPEDVDRWVAQLRESRGPRGEPPSSHAVQYAYDRLMECLRALRATGFRRDGIDAILDPARRGRPRHRKRPTPAYDVAQSTALLGHLAAVAEAQHPWPAFFGACLHAGLRFSEGAGLYWSHLHGLELFAAWLDRGRARGAPLVTLTVAQQLDRDTRRPREPKSAAGLRTVPLTREAAELLVGHLRRERAAGRPTAGERFVFVAPSRDRTMRELGYANARRKLAALCDGAGLGSSGKTHVLRATFGTAAGAAGVPRHILKGVMGHADEKTTGQYTRFVKEDARRTTDKLGRRLTGARRPARGSGVGEAAD